MSSFDSPTSPVRPLDALSARLRSADMVQVMVGYFALLVFVLLFAWPAASSPVAARPNDSWFVFTQVKLLALLLLGLSYGANVTPAPAAERRVTLAALLVLAVFTLPLELGAYAGSLPGAPLTWSPLLGFLTVCGFFGVGLALGGLLGVLRLRALLPLAVPLLVVGLFFGDLWLGLPLLNPSNAANRVTLPYLAFSGFLSLGTFLYLLRPTKIERTPLQL